MANRARPLSPHLQVYRWRANMLVSILHRATGVGLTIAGAGILLWWLLAAASGAEAYARFLEVALTPVGLLVLFGLTAVFWQHFFSGLRHLYMDTGAGFEPAKSRQLASLTILGTVVATVATWAIIFFA